MLVKTRHLVISMEMFAVIAPTLAMYSDNSSFKNKKEFKMFNPPKEKKYFVPAMYPN